MHRGKKFLGKIFRCGILPKADVEALQGVTPSSTMARALLVARQQPWTTPMQIPSSSNFFGTTSSKAASGVGSATNVDTLSGKAYWRSLPTAPDQNPYRRKTISFRDTLEDLGGGLGVTDPVAGPVVLNLK